LVGICQQMVPIGGAHAGAPIHFEIFENFIAATFSKTGSPGLSKGM
jgi:hypothetical protein